MIHLLLAIIYLAFISLGLPDSLLGAAWPTMYVQFGVQVSYAGIISMIISVGTIISSLQSDRLTKKLGTGKLTAISVGITAVALFGFSISSSFWMLCLWAIPYGLGAGSVDASLNNYVALHFESRHMSWLHCMWGIGASAGPYIMGYALGNGSGWPMGYRYISIIQIVLTCILFISLPLWKTKNRFVASETENIAENITEKINEPLKLKDIIKIPGAKEVMIMFFCYCAIESTAGLWSSSYLVMKVGMTPERAAWLASMPFIGVTIGRALSGFMTMRFSDTQMIHIGQGLIAIGAAVLFIPLGEASAMTGLMCLGFGCAPIYPCIIHSTPDYFGADKSQAVIGVQMASAYCGTCLMPPLFGLIANYISVALFPVFLLAGLAAMVIMHIKLENKTRG